MVAIVIFSMAVAGVITVAVQGGLNVNRAKYALTASYLADEGIELMRGFRDSTVLATPGAAASGWANFLSTSTAECSSAAPCDIDAANFSNNAHFPDVSNIKLPCVLTVTGVTGKFCPLSYDNTISSTGYYNDQSRGYITPYSRSIVVTQISSDEALVTSTVAWMEGTVGKSISTSEHLFNWSL